MPGGGDDKVRRPRDGDDDGSDTPGGTHMTSLAEPLTTESRSLAVLAGPVLERLMDDLAETGITVRLTEGRPQIGADPAGTAVTDPRSGRVIGSVTLVGSSADDRDLMASLAL